MGTSDPEFRKLFPEMESDDPWLGMMIFEPGKTDPGFNFYPLKIAWLDFEIKRFNFEINDYPVN